MKKLMAIILAAAMVFGLAATAMAEEPKVNTGAGSQAVEIGFSVPESFEWSIPDMDMGVQTPVNGEVNIDFTGDVTFTDCYLLANHHIELIARPSAMCGENNMDGFTPNGFGFSVFVNGAQRAAVVYPTSNDFTIPIEIKGMYPISYQAGVFEDQITFLMGVVENG